MTSGIENWSRPILLHHTGPPVERRASKRQVVRLRSPVNVRRLLSMKQTDWMGEASAIGPPPRDPSFRAPTPS
jgi:hypothetical protein